MGAGVELLNSRAGQRGVKRLWTNKNPAIDQRLLVIRRIQTGILVALTGSGVISRTIRLICVSRLCLGLVLKFRIDLSVIYNLQTELKILYVYHNYSYSKVMKNKFSLALGTFWAVQIFLLLIIRNTLTLSKSLNVVSPILIGMCYSIVPK